MKTFLGLDVKKLVLKTLATGGVLALLTLVDSALLTWLNSMGLGWMQYIVMIVSAFALVWAMSFRKGKEDLFEALVSMGLIYGVFGLLGFLLKFNLFTGYTSMSLSDVIMFFVLFFISEGVTQRILKTTKAI